MNICPPRHQLAQLLDESDAVCSDDTLVEHLGVCEDCQQVLVELSNESGEWDAWEKRLDTTDVHWPHAGPRSGSDHEEEIPTVPGYEIQSVIGQGGMGIVYRAEHLSLKRTVALKVMRAGWEEQPHLQKCVMREAYSLAQLQHPNLVQIYDIIEREEGPILALEFVEGGSLAERLREATLSPKEAASVVEVLAHAIQSAHDSGIVHRDLKPANILISGDRDDPVIRSPQSQIKVTDFGLARRVTGSADSLQQHLMGTPSYMAPEQARGIEGWNQPPVDVYALGAVLYESLTGRPPFRAESACATLIQVVRQDVVPPSQVQPRLPQDLETICLKCLEKEPSKRYATCKDLAEDLSRFRKGEPILARRTPIRTRVAKWVKRHPLSASLLVALLLSLGVLLTIWIRFTRDLQNLNAALKEENRKVRNEKKLVEMQRKKARNNVLQMIGVLKSYHERIRSDKVLMKPEMNKLRSELLEKTYDSIASIVPRLGNEPELGLQRAQEYHWLSRASWALGKRQKALEYLKKAVAIQKAIAPQQLVRGQSLLGVYTLHLGLLLNRLGKKDKAEQRFLEAASIFQQEVTQNAGDDGLLHFYLADAQYHRYQLLDQEGKKMKEARQILSEAKNAIRLALKQRKSELYEELATRLNRIP